MTGSVRKSEIPPDSLLHAYAADGGYADAYATEIACDVRLDAFVDAFYTSWLFNLERRLLAAFAHRPSTRHQARELGRGTRTQFAAWTVEGRERNEILLTDFRGRTRSWLKVEPLAAGRTRLYFGSAVVPTRDGDGEARLGAPFALLLGFHKLYSRLLLDAAADLLPREKTEFEIAHWHAGNHRREIHASSNCACFHCLARFAPADVEDWQETTAGGPDAEKEGATALCPSCDVAAVLGSAAGFALEPAFLQRLRRYWF